METVFSKLIGISLMANWLILAVIVLRLPLKKVPRRITCILWLIVALRLMVPISIESPVSMIPQTTSVIQEAVDTNLIHPEVISSDVTPEPSQNETNAAYVRNGQHMPVLPLIWCIGMAMMLCYFAFSYLRMRRLVREAVWETENIWICDAVTTPFILGLLRPRIYLPSGLSGATRECVIAHEQSHLRWKDHWWKPLAFVLLSAYWFDPLVWVSYALLCRDIEFACDERVVRHYGITDKKAYSKALLECSDGKRLVLACPVAFGETAVVQRIQNVLRYKRPRFWIILICAVLVAVMAVGFLTVPVKTAAPDLQEPAPAQDTTEATNPSVQTEPATVPMTNSEEDGRNDEWAGFRDGVQVDTYAGKTFSAHVMLVRDPSAVYLATASHQLSEETPGIPMDEAMEQENAIAAVNAGSYFDDGSSSPAVGSVPCGLVLSKSAVVWDDLHDMALGDGFAGFNKDNILIVGNSMTAAEAADLGIRDGCAAGPVLIINGKPVTAVYDGNSGYNQRTAIGQRSDGTVIFVCVEGRTADSLGATYADLIDIMTEYGAVNACAMTGGSSSNMLYRDTEGRYGTKGQTQMFNPYPIGTTYLGRRPTFWMVSPAD